MPGSVSDAYDPEWGTEANRLEIEDALDGVYKRVSKILKRRPPMPIQELVGDRTLTETTHAALSEKDWRLIRFAIERAKDAL